jgi:hypothetical protein
MIYPRQITTKKSPPPPPPPPPPPTTTTTTTITTTLTHGLPSQILKLLIQHGGQLKESEGRDCMSAAIQHKEFHLAEQLMELGIPPQHLSLEKGDTPLHAALTIALDKDKGQSKSMVCSLGHVCRS